MNRQHAHRVSPREYGPPTRRELVDATPGGILLALTFLAVLVVLGGFAGVAVTP